MKSAMNLCSESEVRIEVRDAVLRGDLHLPENLVGLVLFAHGSGSGRKSSRNRAVARFLQSRHMGTLLFDLLTEEEEQIDRHTAHLRFDIPLLANRLIQATQWIQQQDRVPTGYFGASTGAAAALIAAAQLGEAISAVVSRGGRPDLAGMPARQVTSPTLLIVGSLDAPVIKLNQSSYARLNCEKQFEIVPGASHLFEEPGTLERVSDLAANWFHRHFAEPHNTTPG